MNHSHAFAIDDEFLDIALDSFQTQCIPRSWVCIWTPVALQYRYHELVAICALEKVNIEFLYNNL